MAHFLHLRNEHKRNVSIPHANKIQEKKKPSKNAPVQPKRFPLFSQKVRKHLNIYWWRKRSQHSIFFWKIRKYTPKDRLEFLKVCASTNVLDFKCQMIGHWCGTLVTTWDLSRDSPIPNGNNTLAYNTSALVLNSLYFRKCNEKCSFACSVRFLLVQPGASQAPSLL